MLDITDVNLIFIYYTFDEKGPNGDVTLKRALMELSP